MENSTNKDLATRRAALSSTYTFPTIHRMDSMNETPSWDPSSQPSDNGSKPIPQLGEPTPNFGNPENRRITRTQSLKEVLHSSDPPSAAENAFFPAWSTRSRRETPSFPPAPTLSTEETPSFPAKPADNQDKTPSVLAKPADNQDKTPSVPRGVNSKDENSAQPATKPKQPRAALRKKGLRAQKQAEIAKEEDELNELIDSLHSSVSERTSEEGEKEIENVWDQKIKEFQELQRRKQKALREVGKAGEESVVGNEESWDVGTTEEGLRRDKGLSGHGGAHLRDSAAPSQCAG